MMRWLDDLLEAYNELESPDLDVIVDRMKDRGVYKGNFREDVFRADLSRTITINALENAAEEAGIKIHINEREKESETGADCSVIYENSGALVETKLGKVLTPAGINTKSFLRIYNKKRIVRDLKRLRNNKRLFSTCYLLITFSEITPDRIDSEKLLDRYRKVRSIDEARFATFYTDREGYERDREYVAKRLDLDRVLKKEREHRSL